MAPAALTVTAGYVTEGRAEIEIFIAKSQNARRRSRLDARKGAAGVKFARRLRIRMDRVDREE